MEPQVRRVGRVRRHPGGRASPSGDAIYVTGESTGVAGTSFGVATIAYEAGGGRRWTSRYDGPAIDRGKAVSVSPDEETVYVGAETGGVNTEFTVFAHDAAAGSVRWTGKYQGEKSGFLNGIAVSPDGSRVFVTGSTGTAQGYVTAAFEAEDEERLGDLLWATVYEPGPSTDRANAIGVSPNGETVFVTGTTLSGGARATTIAYDAATGAERWRVGLGPAGGSGRGNALVVAPDGERLFVAGEQTGQPSADAMVVAVDADTGAVLWRKGYGLDAYVERGKAITLGPGGRDVYVAVQSTANVNVYQSDVVTLAYDAASGTESWVARFNATTQAASGSTGVLSGYPWGIGVTPDGGTLYVGGSADRLGNTANLETRNEDLFVAAYEI